MMREFIGELKATFPEQQELALFVLGYDHLIAMNPRKPLTLFMDAMSPHAQLIMARDDALFSQPLDMGVDLHALWNTEDLSAATRDAIWQYISTLFLLGTTITSLPTHLLENIESVAENCASKIQSGDMNMNDLMRSMSSMMGSATSGPLLPPSPNKKKQKRIQ